MPKLKQDDRVKKPPVVMPIKPAEDDELAGVIHENLPTTHDHQH